MPVKPTLEFLPSPQPPVANSQGDYSHAITIVANQPLSPHWLKWTLQRAMTALESQQIETAAEIAEAREQS